MIWKPYWKGTVVAKGEVAVGDTEVDHHASFSFDTRTGSWVATIKLGITTDAFELALVGQVSDAGTCTDEVRRCKLDPNLKAPGFKGST